MGKEGNELSFYYCLVLPSKITNLINSLLPREGANEGIEMWGVLYFAASSTWNQENGKKKFLVPNIRVPERCGRQGIWQRPCSKFSNEFIKTDLGKRFLIEGCDCNIKTQLKESSSNWSLKNKSRKFRFSKRKLYCTHIINITINSLFFSCDNKNKLLAYEFISPNLTHPTSLYLFCIDPFYQTVSLFHEHKIFMSLITLFLFGMFFPILSNLNHISKNF